MFRTSTQLLLLSSLVLSLSACQRKGATAPAPSVDVHVGPPPGGNLLKNATFDGGKSVPWTSSFTAPARGKAKVIDGALCLTIEDRGVNPWDAQLRHREMVAQEGHTYTASFKIWANQTSMGRVKLGMSGPPYGEYWYQDVPLTTEKKTVRSTFTMRGKDDPTVELAFHLGGRLAQNATMPLVVCIDDVYLSDPEFTPPPAEAEAPVSNVRVNQLGYLLKGPKIATYVTDKKEPLAYQLKEGETVVASGETVPFGPDPASGDSVHTIDFSEVNKEGEFVLVVGDDVSPPFSIKERLYSELKRDAIKYFYHNRSGVPIELPYAVEERWTRPAGHAESDKAVRCAQDAGCDYSLDVSGGWYDAGDFGKYVVNGGFSVWMLLNAWERAELKKTSAALGDGTLQIPESKNGIPDLLDEAAFELDFFLKMQVPEGKPHAGMVHHKIHDVNWTALGLRPDESEKQMERRLRPVSTAATLNAAATLAQGARIFARFDPARSKKYLEAARRAYRAAEKEPKLFIGPEDTTGGGPYDDKNVSDEFYWAEVELFLATQEDEFKKKFLASPLHQASGLGGEGFYWRETAGLGLLSLATHRNVLSAQERAQVEKKLLFAADRLLEIQAKQGYRIPVGHEHGYYWGSNGALLNELVVLAVASDIGPEEKYRKAATIGFDYLLGRNALGQSYITGYGHRPLKNPHHRFWAHQAVSSFPEPPPGAVSGGPNSQIQDPYTEASGLAGCAPQRCFVDHIDAYSVNEVAINWNAALGWFAIYLDEK